MDMRTTSNSLCARVLTNGNGECLNFYCENKRREWTALPSAFSYSYRLEVVSLELDVSFMI